MSDEQSKKRLGRGLAALIGTIDIPTDSEQKFDNSDLKRESEQTVSLDRIIANPQNPRRYFSESEIDDLVQSVREHGIVQPILVRAAKSNKDFFEIIAGERRWRAAQKAGLTTIPAIIRDIDDKTALELSIIENVQRSDLNPLEEALAYQQLVDEYDYSQSDLSKIIGKSRSHLANMLRLLKLPENVQNLVITGALSAGHARCLIGAENSFQLAQEIIKKGLSVRQTEALVAKKNTDLAEERIITEQERKTQKLEKIIEEQIGMQVAIKFNGKANKGGNIRVFYKNMDQFDEICRRLQKS